MHGQLKGEQMERMPVKVGVGVLVRKGDKVALVKRSGSYGFGTWSPPGGHVEFGESTIETARRETMEEIGTEIENLEVLGFTEDIAKDNHYVTVWVRSDWASGELKISDTEFTESGFFKMDDLPEPLFISFRNLIEGKLMPKPLKLGSIV
jgi:8-oxo-dGTP diphosphatase